MRQFERQNQLASNNLVVFWPRDRQPRVSRLANEMGARPGHWAIGQAVLWLIIGGVSSRLGRRGRCAL
ncbi:MAG TPA: hypothetical protein VGJ60_21470 [Chloroflexota bacterium]